MEADKLILAIQNMLFWPLFFLVSFIYIPVATANVVVFSAFLSRRRTMWLTRKAITLYGRLIIRCAWPFAKVCFKDLAPEEDEGPFIFVCNHRSASDPFLMAVLPYEGVQIVKQWPLRLPALGLAARLAGYISIYEITVDSFFRRASKLYEDGVCLISFPEGTRSGSKRMGHFTSAVFRLAKHIQATIVPLAISGNENIPPKGSLLMHPGRVHVHKLPALKWEDYNTMSPFALKNHVRDLLQAEIDRIEGG